ncbi:putative baseplate assembly protein [Hyalangium versicolor]|uniref:putative baseplate assembly protein n=1 Tax=Hyalangium versicolor TaxID=2861190 RepID=UPI001CCCCB65|nr:putative baseplate assembly protein [Hyalangium versicolor]
MPLPTPILDDRSYQQLRDELVRRIPVYSREWTDHNPSDPGITLLELFAFLGENLLFRFNQIPEATQLAFLRLLRIPLRTATSAQSMVAVTTTEPAGSLVPVGSAALASSIPFETTSEVLALPLSTLAVCKSRTAPPQPGDEADFAQAALDVMEISEDEADYYRNESVPLDPSKPGAQPVDFQRAVDGMIWVAVLEQTGVTDLTKLAGRTLNLGFVPDEQITSLDDVDSPSPGEGSQEQSPEVIWEYSTGLIDAETKQPIYRTLAVEGDTSRGLTQQGVVRLKLPKDVTQLGAFTPEDPDMLGAGQFPPALEDEELAQKVKFWIRAWRRVSSDRPFGRVLWVGANATEVVQARKARPEFVGTGNGQPDQQFPLVHKPVLEGSLVLEVEEPGGWRPWTAVEDFHASAEDDRHYVVDLEAGTVRFGNGVKGRAPQIGERVRATEYRYGGGAEGNVPAKAISKLEALPSLKLSNPLPARGGAPAESISEALERVPAEFRRHDRAVTRSDFQELALATPGANVGRAECLSLFHPPTRELRAAGVVSVVVWPREDRQHPNAPMPDRTLLRSVCRWLDARRLITTELWVIPPTYRKVAVAVGLQVKAGYGIEAVSRWVELVLRQYLAPLPPYGPEGNGWPLGRRVLGRELEAAALQVEGVQYLTDDVKVAGWDDTQKKWVAGTVDLKPWEVPELAEITVVEGDPLEPGEALGPPPSPKVGVPIPIIKEEC